MPSLVKRLLPPLLALLAVLALPAAPALAGYDQQQVVDGATGTMERLKTDPGFQKNFHEQMRNARAILIVPNLYRGGIIVGGQYGNGVLLERLPDGGWSYPAFFTLAGGSFGLQLGAESVGVIFLINSERALQALLDNQFKFGANFGMTLAVVGADVGGSTTSNAGADILALSFSALGLYGGLTLDGTAVSPRDSWNAAYYGRNLSSRGIVQDQNVSNPGADRLRDVLAH